MSLEHMPKWPSRFGSVAIAVMAFLTLVDLFATQAILPPLARSYHVSPAAMGFAVNASAIGMAISSLAMAFGSSRVDRRLGVLASLAILAIPTSLLSIAPNLIVFTALRVVQGLCMASAFTLTLAYLGEHRSGSKIAAAFAAYISGNVASNLFGRLMAAALVDHLGLAANFLVFSALNLGGAILALVFLDAAPAQDERPMSASAMLVAIADHFRNSALRSAFAVGFCTLFAFIGTFTYVNFVLVRPPISLGMMSLGFVYFVFFPSLLTTPAAGEFVRRFGARSAICGSLGVALLGLPLLLAPSLVAIVGGLMLVGAGTFFAQAAATGYVGRVAIANRGAASALYLASYFSGGLFGGAVLGQIFDAFGWPACVTGIGLALIAAVALAISLKSEEREPAAAALMQIEGPAH